MRQINTCLKIFAVACICIGLFSGCIQMEHPTSRSSSTATSSLDSSSPTSVSGTYEGKAIEMKISVVTDLKWDETDVKTSVFVNGFAAVYLFELDGEGERILRGASYMDEDGRLISEPNYMMLKDFNEDGLALALGLDEVYYVLDKNGEVVETRSEDNNEWSVFNYESPYVDADGFVFGLKTKKSTDQWEIIDTSGKTVASLPGTFREANVVAKDVVVCTYGDQQDGLFGQYMQLYSADGKLLNDMKFERIGTFYNGLSPVYKDGKLGLISDKGDMVIPLSIDCRADHRFIAFNEDRIVVSIDGNVSIIEVIRS